MTTRDLARRAATELSALLAAESRAGFAWQQRMWQVAACLSADATDDEALRSARARFEAVHPRLAEFRLSSRADRSAHERLAALTARLHDLLNQPPTTLRRARAADADRIATIWRE